MIFVFLNSKKKKKSLFFYIKGGKKRENKLRIKLQRLKLLLKKRRVSVSDAISAKLLSLDATDLIGTPPPVESE